MPLHPVTRFKNYITSIRSMRWLRRLRRPRVRKVDGPSATREFTSEKDQPKQRERATDPKRGNELDVDG